MTADLHPEFLQALHTEIRTQDPSAFLRRLESHLRFVLGHRRAWKLERPALKLLIRHQSRRFDEAAEQARFADGAYFPLFTFLYDLNRSGRQHAADGLERLYELSAGLDDPVSSPAAMSSRVIRTWSRLMRPGTVLEPTPATQLMLWRVVESLVKGELEIAEADWMEPLGHYPRFASAERLMARRQDERRAEVLSSLRFTLGCASLRRPSLLRLLQRHDGFSEGDREALLASVGSSDPRSAEPISALLRHHTELVALAGYDRLDPFAALLGEFLVHLRTEVLTRATVPVSSCLLEYLRVVQEQYLPGLFNYCRILRTASHGSPFLGDLLHESYLVRTRGLDGDQEPTFARLLQDWSSAQRVLQSHVGYDEPGGFSFLRAYLREAQPDAVESPLGEPQQTRRGFAVKPLEEFETLLGVDDDAAVPEVAPPPSPGASAPRDPAEIEVDEQARTLTFRRPNVLTVPAGSKPLERSADPAGDALPAEVAPLVLPLSLEAVEDLHASTTEILPIFDDERLVVHSAATEILPVTESGEVDLHRVATMLLPTLPLGDDEPA